MSSATLPSPSAAHPGGFVSEATWTDGPWPLTVSEGTLACHPLGAHLGRVTFTSGGTTYWVNGTAKAAHKYADLDDIWRDNPDIPGTKINIGPLLDRGLALC
ncbi:hypothetical protein ABH37_00790 [Mycobacterium haemophilum]|nr:DUF2511 domain-containing protein [Mycobacterium haemophilum]KLO45365.1 hypothetical protein ABH37_00790 [Mycobacterium haemophilum]